MNVFHKFTRMSLKRNRSRTLVTVIGIILSMSLFTAVICGAYSGIQYLIRSEIAEVGAYHGHSYELTAEELKSVSENAEIEEAAYWQEVGWADIGSENEYKPYLLIEAVSGNFTDMVAVHILKGRMPENDSEILLPEHLAANGNVKFSVGDTLTLQVGKRTSDGYALSAQNPYSPDADEEITGASEKTYTVVGIYSRLHYTIEKFDCPGYTALTAGSGNGNYSLFFTLKHPSQYYNYMERYSLHGRTLGHSSLLALCGSLSNGNTVLVLYGFAAILIFLIAFGSISLIYNSFSISVSERTKQFGILKSVGATKKQIHSSVLYEALFLCAIGIPIGLVTGCTGIGITLWCLRDSFSSIMGSGDVQMRLVLNPVVLLIAALICLVTTLISAWIPAKKAIRVNAIDAIRQTGDVRIRRKDVKSFRLTQKLFGFEGMLAAKNFRRDRKRYRSTVVSLFMSITLFIAASSFCSYLTDTIGGLTSGSSNIDISYYVDYSDTGNADTTPDTLLHLLLEADGVDSGCYSRNAYIGLKFDSDVLTKEYQNLPFVSIDTDSDSFIVSADILFLDDNAFLQLCKDNGLESGKYFNTEAPLGLAVNNITSSYSEDPDGKSPKYYNYDLLSESQLPVIGSTREYTVSIDGYEYYDKTEDESGNILYRYFPLEYMEDFRQNNGETKEPDEHMAMLLSEEQALNTIHFTIADIVEQLPYYLSGCSSFCIIYPHSMMNTILSEEYMESREYIHNISFAFAAKNHTQAYSSMKSILSDNNLATGPLYDAAASKESERMMVTVINVFSYGFIILISLIALANVFNTISTNVALRRREFAMLKSIGLSQKGFRRMMNYECIIYGVRSLMWGLPASALLTYIIYSISGHVYESSFYIPWYSIVIAVGSVFAVVFATMLYATNKIRRDNPIDALKTENI